MDTPFIKEPYRELEDKVYDYLKSQEKPELNAPPENPNDFGEFIGAD